MKQLIAKLKAFLKHLSDVFNAEMNEHFPQSYYKYNRNTDLPKDTYPMYHLNVPINPDETLPCLVDLRFAMPPIYDQGQEGSCTANASVRSLEYLRMQEALAAAAEITGYQHTLKPRAFDPKLYVAYSRQMIYYNERRMDGDTGEDAGATIADSTKSLLYYGVCKESTWPYDESTLTVKPSPEAYSEAAKNKIAKYYRFADTQHIKHSLASGYPINIGITVFESFESDSVAETGNIPLPNIQYEQCLGGHAVCVVGYDDSKKAFIVANSWGEDWGDKGYFYLPYAYVENPDLSSDWWTIRQ